VCVCVCLSTFVSLCCVGECVYMCLFFWHMCCVCVIMLHVVLCVFVCGIMRGVCFLCVV